MRSCFAPLLLLALPFSARTQDLQGMNCFLDSCQKQLGFHGSVLLLRNDSTLLHRGFGYSDRKRKIPTDPATVYQVASVTKGVTAIAVMKLAEQGRLRMEDPISRYFPEAGPDKSSITIGQLLTHRSGLPQGYSSDGIEARDKAAQVILQAPLTDTPGGRFQYSNDNYSLLGILIERISGQSFEIFIRSEVLQPLGMNDTRFWSERDKIPAPMAAPNAEISKAARKRNYGMLGASGLFMNVTDLARLGGALATDRVLSAATRKQWLQPVSKVRSEWAGFTTHYGYSVFHTRKDNGAEEALWWRGLEDGWGGAVVLYFPARGLTLAILTNTVDLKNGERTTVFLARELRRFLDR